ncbi:TetR/AcrR family transcriptional regulator [Paractinoplanes durhamensis]|uniref:TetR family transcriptional regulator n=1 Tax=Paractinoplanes durhamensis TaxID=113563 RepID=A0ABQ3Z2Q8_9ACTN|nr:TetR/AcrR family transcriptional regulator [Actinoplanes durhamensis]GIE04115.1 TetR family transcriptional regulator [Actinoplanes durhamensis]
MTVRERREREREDRERRIIDAAREIAEAEGWDAVTTRRLAERIEYSQPVLYSHFKGKDAIMAAVAIDGFAELAAELRAARTEAGLAEVATAYTRFAETRPVLYETMFTSAVDLTFASTETPAPLQAGFGELREALRATNGDEDLDAQTEVFWASLHGLMTLMRGGRLRREDHDRRLALLLQRFSGQARRGSFQPGRGKWQV